MTGAGARLRRAMLFLLAFVVLVALWEGYKAIGPASGGKLFGWRILPRTENAAMPHFWDVLTRFNRPELRGSNRTIFSVVAAGSWFTMLVTNWSLPPTMCHLSSVPARIGAVVGWKPRPPVLSS